MKKIKKTFIILIFVLVAPILAYAGLIDNLNDDVYELTNDEIMNNEYHTEILNDHFTILGNNFAIDGNNVSEGIVLDKNKELDIMNLSCIKNFTDAFLTNAGGVINLYSTTTDIEFNNNNNAINNMSGVINLYISKNYKIVFNNKIVVDKPAGDNSDVNEININNDNYKGTIVLNADMNSYTGNVNIYNGIVEVSNNGTWFNNAKVTLDMINYNITSNSIVIKNAQIKNTLYLQLDVDLVNKSMDTIFFDNVVFDNNAKIVISELRLLNDSYNDGLTIRFTDDETIYDKIIVDSCVIKNRKYKYAVEYNNDGTFVFLKQNIEDIPATVVNSLNSTQVALVGGYLMQSNIMNQALSRISTTKFNTQIDNTIESGLWITPFGMQESIKISGVDVDSKSYGTLAGVDLKAGDNSKFSIYGGVTSSKQEKNDLNVNQVGYVVGVSAMTKNDKLFVIATGNIGTNSVTVKDDDGNDDFDMFLYSIGAQVGYSIDCGKNFSIEPTLLAWYGNTKSNEYNSQRQSDMKVSSRTWNNIQLEPMIKAEMKLNNYWTPYLFFGYAFNFGDKIEQEDNAVDEMGEHGYFEYGLGLNKDFIKHCLVSLQVIGRSGDRSGIGGNIGFKYVF